MISGVDKAILATSLCGLFAAGMGSGYFLGTKQATATQPPQTQVAADTATANARDWWERTLQRLSQDLQLADHQKERVLPLLQGSTEQIFHHRDRGLFQIHLELLGFHDRLASQPELLTAPQLASLKTMRERLAKEIAQQFPQYLKDHPLPAAAPTL